MTAITWEQMQARLQPGTRVTVEGAYSGTTVITSHHAKQAPKQKGASMIWPGGQIMGIINMDFDAGPDGRFAGIDADTFWLDDMTIRILPGRWCTSIWLPYCDRPADVTVDQPSWVLPGPYCQAHADAMSKWARGVARYDAINQWIVERPRVAATLDRFPRLAYHLFGWEVDE